MRTLVGASAVAVAMRSFWLANSALAKEITGALRLQRQHSLPLSFTTVSFTLPPWTYITLSAASPWEKIVCFYAEASTCVMYPTDSRNTSVSEYVFLWFHVRTPSGNELAVGHDGNR